MSVSAILRTCAFAAGIVLFSTVTQGQTRLDPARAATATQPDAAAQSIIRAQEEASSGGLDMENVFAPVSPGDEDIGQQLILKRNEKNQPFSVWLDSSIYWTDNAANVHEGEIDDWFYVGGVNVAWQQRLHSRFYADVYAGQHWYRYDELSELDYESGEASAGLLVVLPELGNSIFHAHYYYQRITQDIGDDPIYETHNIRVGLQKTFLINRLNSINASYMSSFALETDPEVLQRHEHSLLLGYNFKIKRDWILNLSYRLAYYDYFNLENRHDWYHNLGAALLWRPSEHFEASLGYYFTLNESNFDIFSYESHLAGPALAVRYKF
ncbi:hypothetical protein AYO49_01000 [Verrucomicrobiaceae bacterium SCGC AG-212-N21]|nr:hypothetical protein AYO49_01000 [Verrucomicrobiaceae bacterium SCGC AG-212-N21]